MYCMDGPPKHADGWGEKKGKDGTIFMFPKRKKKKSNTFMKSYIYIHKYICIHALKKDLMVNNNLRERVKNEIESQSRQQIFVCLGIYFTPF